VKRKGGTVRDLFGYCRERPRPPPRGVQDLPDDVLVYLLGSR
jgi:hypothetical protein